MIQMTAVSPGKVSQTRTGKTTTKFDAQMPDGSIVNATLWQAATIEAGTVLVGEFREGQPYQGKRQGSISDGWSILNGAAAQQPPIPGQMVEVSTPNVVTGGQMGGAPRPATSLGSYNSGGVDYDGYIARVRLVLDNAATCIEELAAKRGWASSPEAMLSCSKELAVHILISMEKGSVEVPSEIPF